MSFLEGVVLDVERGRVPRDALLAWAAMRSIGSRSKTAHRPPRAGPQRGHEQLPLLQRLMLAPV